MAVRALKAGAMDFIEKPFDAGTLLESLAAALERGARAAARRETLETARTRHARLTERELEVLQLIVEGCSNAVVAERLGISVRTVENHRARIMDKMEAGSLSELVRLHLLFEDSA